MHFDPDALRIENPFLNRLFTAIEIQGCITKLNTLPLAFVSQKNYAL